MIPKIQFCPTSLMVLGHIETEISYKEYIENTRFFNNKKTLKCICSQKSGPANNIYLLWKTNGQLRLTNMTILHWNIEIQIWWKIAQMNYLLSSQLPNSMDKYWSTILWPNKCLILHSEHRIMDSRFTNVWRKTAL